MLFFRSEEAIDEWCRSGKMYRAPSVTLTQLWRMAVTWYGNRLSAEARRPGPQEIRKIFGEIGLTDPFWDPEADKFG